MEKKGYRSYRNGVFLLALNALLVTVVVAVVLLAVGRWSSAVVAGLLAWAEWCLLKLVVLVEKMKEEQREEDDGK